MKVIWLSNEEIEKLAKGHKRQRSNGWIRGMCNKETSPITIVINTRILHFKYPFIAQINILFHELCHFINIFDIKIIHKIIDKIHLFFDDLKLRRYDAKCNNGHF